MTAFAAYEAEAGLPDGADPPAQLDRPGHQRLGPLRAQRAGRRRVLGGVRGRGAGGRAPAGRVAGARGAARRSAADDGGRGAPAAGRTVCRWRCCRTTSRRWSAPGRWASCWRCSTPSSRVSTEGVRKPEPEIYRRALTRLSEAVGRPIEAADCAYLDDLGINLKPARALGLLAPSRWSSRPRRCAELSELVGFPLARRRVSCQASCPSDARALLPPGSRAQSVRGGTPGDARTSTPRWAGRSSSRRPRPSGATPRSAPSSSGRTARCSPRPPTSGRSAATRPRTPRCWRCGRPRRCTATAGG